MTEHRGSYTVTVTPFDEETRAYDEAAMRGFVDWQIEQGVPGLIILGSMGEFLLIDDDERTHIVESTVDQAAGRIPIFVGTMDAHTDNAVRYSKEAEALGAAGLMITPPYYYTPTEDEIFEYYKAISEAVSIPIMLYNQPFLCNVDMSAAFVAKLTKAFENIRYIKEATGHADRVYDIVRLTDGVMNCFAGNRVYECFLFGATGYVSPPGNYAPRPAVAMWEMLERGEMETAKKISDGLVDFFEALFEGCDPYGYLSDSHALCRLAGHPMGDVRPPHTPHKALGASAVERVAKLKRMLDEVEALVRTRAAAQ